MSYKKIYSNRSTNIDSEFYGYSYNFEKLLKNQQTKMQPHCGEIDNYCDVIWFNIIILQISPIFPKQTNHKKNSTM